MYKRQISILSCGGTIASKVEYRTGAVTPIFRAEDIVRMVPYIKDIAMIKSKNIINIASEDIQPEHWQIIAREVYNEIKTGAKGIVITHGTDFMHYTSAALSFMLSNLAVPVVLTGAQRSSDRPSSDAFINLTCSVIVAKSNIAEVGICMHSSINDDYCYFHRGTRVRKMHTLSLIHI